MFSVRPAREDDAPAITEIINRDYPEPATVEQVRERIRDSRGGRTVTRLVATDDATGQVVGYGHM